MRRMSIAPTAGGTCHLELIRRNVGGRRGGPRYSRNNAGYHCAGRSADASGVFAKDFLCSMEVSGDSMKVSWSFFRGSRSSMWVCWSIRDRSASSRDWSWSTFRGSGSTVILSGSTGTLAGSSGKRKSSRGNHRRSADKGRLGFETRGWSAWTRGMGALNPPCRKRRGQSVSRRKALPAAYLQTRQFTNVY